jgi:hypothetical protein
LVLSKLFEAETALIKAFFIPLAVSKILLQTYQPLCILLHRSQWISLMKRFIFPALDIIFLKG